MRRERNGNGVARVAGAALAQPLLILLAKLLGVEAVVAIACGLMLTLLVAIAVVLRDRLRLRRMERRFCDDALHYARKARAVDGRADFAPGELAAIARLRRRRDHAGIARLIAESNARLRASEPAHPVAPLEPRLRALLYAGT